MTLDDVNLTLGESLSLSLGLMTGNDKPGYVTPWVIEVFTVVGMVV